MVSSTYLHIFLNLYKFLDGRTEKRTEFYVQFWEKKKPKIPLHMSGFDDFWRHWIQIWREFSGNSMEICGNSVEMLRKFVGKLNSSKHLHFNLPISNDWIFL